MTKPTDQRPTPVSSTTKQVGQAPQWAEPSVWTERMLTALANGVKGGAFFADQGLFSLAKAHVLVRQSSTR